MDDDLDKFLDVMVESILTILGVTDRTAGNRPGQIDTLRLELKQALTKLIADRERGARIDELGKLPAFDGSEGRVRFYYTKRVTELRKEGDK